MMRERVEPVVFAVKEASAADVLLLVEVSDSSVGYDRGQKLDVYARHRVREVWIVDLTADAMSVFRDPDKGVYQTHLILHPGEAVASLAFPGLQLSVSDLLNLDHNVA